MGDSLAFDRAASSYDRTRRLPPGAQQAVLRQLQEELESRAPCLEIGVGTGRFALPLVDRGLEMMGIDVSVPMLQQLVLNSGGRIPFPIFRADACRLPFADGVLGAGLVIHVLHLIPEWEAAVRELRRCVRSGGVVIVDLGGRSPEIQAFEAWLLGEFGRERRPGLTSPEFLKELMEELRATERILPPITFKDRRSPAKWIGQVEADTYSFTWGMEESEKQRLIEGLREWFRGQGLRLDAPRDLEVAVTLRVYDIP